MNYPRVLVVCDEPFNYFRGAGITMSSLFRGWNKHSIATIYWQNVQPDNSLCRNYFCLAGMKPPSEALDSWVKKFSPDLIYCPVANTYGIDLVNHLADISGASVAVHIYDDWISVVGMQRRNVIAAWRERHYLIPKFQQLLKRAAVRMTIGQKMSREYERRYGHRFLWFQNAPEPLPWLEHGKQSWTAKHPFVIRFTGNIYDRGNLQAIVEVAQAVEEMRKQSVDVRLEIYTIRDNIEAYRRAFTSCAGSSLHLTVEKTADMARLYGTADALLLAYNFDRQGSRWLGYSMPTKLPTSMLSGTPIFAYAPASSAVADYLSQTSCGCVVSQKQSTPALALKIQEFYHDDELRKQIGLKAREVALRDFSADSVRPQFVQALVNAVRPAS